MSARLNKFYCMRTGNWSSFRKLLADIDFFKHGYNNIFSYLCNYMLKDPCSTDPTSYTPQRKDSKVYLFPKVQLFQLDRNADIKNKILDTAKMCLITDSYRHNSPRLVQTLYQGNVYLQESTLVLYLYLLLHLWI